MTSILSAHQLGLRILKSDKPKLEGEHNNSLKPEEAPENPNFIEEVLVGMLLGAGWLEKHGEAYSNPRVRIGLSYPRERSPHS